MAGRLDRAALTCDVSALRELASTLPPSSLAAADGAGRTAMHRVVGGLFYFKAGELSSLIPWPNASRTVYEYSVRHLLVRALAPVVRAMLQKAPTLATAADERGVTALHLAARNCADGLVSELLRAGASPMASVRHVRRTPLDEAMANGCIEVVHMLIAALPTDGERREAEAAASQYALLAGAALLPQYFSSASGQRRPKLEGAASSDAAAGCTEGGGWDVAPPPSEAERASCDLDQLSGLSPAAFLAKYYLSSRPVLLRNAYPLSVRCAFGRHTDSMRSTVHEKSRCGRTAYPVLTGQRPCGAFSLADLNSHPHCDDAEKTLPVCARKPSNGELGVNTSVIFKELPSRLRQRDQVRLCHRHPCSCHATRFTFTSTRPSACGHQHAAASPAIGHHSCPSSPFLSRPGAGASRGGAHERLVEGRLAPVFLGRSALRRGAPLPQLGVQPAALREQEVDAHAATLLRDHGRRLARVGGWRAL